MIKICIDPLGTGTTAIVVFKDNKLIDKKELKNSIWSIHFTWIIEQINEINSLIL